MADEKIYTNVGHATAYAYAKSKGYTGTEDQFATDQANFAANAQQVRGDKESVEATVATFGNTTVPAAVQTVTAEGTRQVGIVGTAGDTQVARVQAEGTTQVGVVQTEGTTQKNAVQAKGDEVIASIPSDYTELTEEVEDLKSSISQNGNFIISPGTGASSAILNVTSGSNANTASGDYSYAEGFYTSATGTNSHAEGDRSTASGESSHAEGTSTTASGRISHAEGLGTIANHVAQRASGAYNVADPSTAAVTAKGNYIEIVGNGTSNSNRSNARTLDWDGNEVLAGNLTVEGGSITVGQTTFTENQLSGGVAAPAMIAAAYDATKTYSIGNYVTHENKLYRAIVDIPTAEVWDGTHWEEVKLTDEVENLKSALSAEDATVNSQHSLVNYGYDTPYHKEAKDQGTSWKNIIGVDRNGQIVVLNLATPGTGVSVVSSARVKVNGDIDFAANNSGVQEWTTGLTLKTGHIYRIKAKLLGGTCSDGDNLIYVPEITVYKAGYSTSIGTSERSADNATFIRQFTAEENAQYNITLRFNENNAVLVNAKILVTMEDLTESEWNLTKALIAPVLDSMTADTALSTNEFRIVGDTLYRITASVASGGTLTPGTNCTVTTIGEQLTALLNA